MSSNTNIGNTPVNQGYVQLIHMGETGGIDGTLRALYDGDGTASDLLIASNSVKVSTTLYIGSITLAEYIQDTAGAMFTGNTETNITATYQDADGTIDLVSTGEVTLVGSQTLTNKTLTAPVLTGVTQGADITLSGDLTVNGTTVTVDQTNLDVSDNIIGLNRGASSNANDSGLIIERGTTGNNAAIIWDESADKFIVGTTTATPSATGDLIIASGTLVASTFEGAVTGNASTATALASAGTLTFTGDVIGSSTPTYTGGGNLSIAMAIQANSIALGTDTTGNYMAQVSAGTGVSISHTQSEGSTATISSNDSAIVHDNLSGFVANEHLDWTTDRGVTNIHAGNYTDTNTTYASSDFTHDDLIGFVANEHIDWTTDQGVTNIHAGNYTDTDTNTNQLTTFNVTGDSGTPESIAQGNTLDIAGGTGIATVVSATDTVTVNLSHLGLEDLADPNDDRILFWDESVGAGKLQWLDIGSNISISGTAISATNTTYVSNDFDHDALLNFVVAEHVDWAGASAGTIHASNYTDTVTTIDGTTANGVLTYGGTNNIDTESALTFDGSTLAVTGASTISSTLQMGSTAGQGGAKINARVNGNAFNFGHSNQSGYGSTLGCNSSQGYPFLALYSEAGTNANTFRTRGVKGVVLTADTSNNFTINQVATASADNQTLTERVRIDSSGNVGIGVAAPASKLHIAASGSYSAPTGGLDGNINLLINNTQYSGIQILGRNDGSSFIHFGDQNDANVGVITYEHSGDYMAFRTNATEAMRFDSSQNTIIPATSKLYFDGGGNTYIHEASADVAEIYVGGTRLLQLAEGATNYVSVGDGTYLAAGNDLNLNFSHNGSTSTIQNHTGDFYIQNTADDKDLILRSDDGLGGVTAYLQLDGSAVITTVHKHLRTDDNVKLLLGTGSDLEVWHNGTNSLIDNNTGDLYIRQTLDDKDIILQSDDGSGGLTAYLTLDGSAVQTIIHKHLRTDDNVKLLLGTGSDLEVWHNGTNSLIDNNTGDLYIRNMVDDKDIILQSDDGLGGLTAYLTLDGSTGHLNLTPPNNVGIGIVPKTGGSTWQHIQFGGTGNLIARKSDTTIDSMFANNYYVNSSNVDSYIATGAAARMFFNDNVITFDQAASGSADAAISFSTSMKIDALGDVKITESLGVGVAANGTTGRIDASNDVVAYSTSDKRLKENITPLDNALDKVMNISGVSFDWKELTEEDKKTIHGNTGHDVGVIAQEIEKVLPEVVTTRDNGYKAVKYEKIVPLLIEAIKEQQVQIDELKECQCQK